MMKKRLSRLLAVTLTVAVASTTNMMLSFADETTQLTVSGNATSEDIPADQLTISDNNETDVTVMGHKGKREQVLQQQAENPASENFVFTLPDAGTWRYAQTFARTELFTAFQNARMNPDNWWSYTSVNGDNYVREELPEVTNAYVYDYNLEAVAMQRAIELSVNYAHLRPDGVTSYEAYSECKSPTETADVNPYWYGTNASELISYLGKTAEEVVDIYMEEDEPAGCQAHRRGILDNDYYRIGIGCVITDMGEILTAIEVAEDSYEPEYYDEHPELYGQRIPLCSESPAIDTYVPVEIKLSPRQDASIMVCALEQIYDISDIILEKGETYNLNDIYYGFSYGTPALFKGTDAVIGTWYSSDESVATVKDGIVTAVGEGTVRIQSEKTVYAYAVVDFKVTAPPKQTETESENKQDNTGTNAAGDADTSDAGKNTDTSNSSGQTTTSGSSGTDKQNVATAQNAAVRKQTIKVAKKFQKTYTIKRTSLKKKAKTYKLGTVVNGGKSHGRVTYKVTKYPKGGKKYITVDKKGKVTIKKNAKKGTYKITITVAAVKGKYKKATKTVTIRVK